MVDEKKPAAPAAEAEKAEAPAQSFMFRVKQHPHLRGESRPQIVAPMAKGMAFRSGDVYTHLIQVVPLKGPKTGSVEKRVPLTEKLCAELKAIMEESWSGPSYVKGIEVAFSPVAA